MTDLSVLVPQPVTVKVDGKLIAVRPVKLRDFERFGESAAAVLSMMEGATPARIFEFAKKSGALHDVICTCTSLSSWQVNRLPAATAFALMIEIMGANSGFFGEALVSAGSRWAGAMSSSD